MLTCPGCFQPRPADATRCAHCGLPLSGPVAGRLGAIDRQLRDVDAEYTGTGRAIAGIDRSLTELGARRGELGRQATALLQRRTALVGERTQVVATLRAGVRERDVWARPGAGVATEPVTQAVPATRAVPPRRPVGGVPVGGVPVGGVPVGGVPVGEPVGGVAGGGPVAPRWEASTKSVQNVLLALGGLLLGVGLVVFTVVAWGVLGIGGRAAILAVITTVALAVPIVLHRRGLTATAETIGALALVLLVLDGYAAWYVGIVPDGLAGTTYAGLVAAAVSLVAAGYPLLAGPRPAAVAGWHVVLPLLVADSDPPLGVWALALLVTLAADLAVIRFSDGAVRVLAWIGAGLTTPLTGLVAAIGLALDESWVWVAGLVLAGLVGIRLLGAELVRFRAAARGVAAGGAVFTVSVGSVIALVRWGDEQYSFLLMAGLALVAAGLALALPGGWRHGVRAGSAMVGGLAAIPPVIWTLGTAALALRWTAEPWTRGATDVLPAPDRDAQVPFVAVVLALAAVLLIRRRELRRPDGTTQPVTGTAQWPALWPAAITLVVMLAVLTPPAFSAPAWTVVAVAGLAGGALAWFRWSFVPGVVLVTYALVAALAAEVTTLVALPLAVAGFGALAVRRAWPGAVAAGGALVTFAGTVAAVAVAVGATAGQVAPALLVALVPAVAVVRVLRALASAGAGVAPGGGPVPVRSSAGYRLHADVMAWTVVAVGLVATGLAIDAGRVPFALLATGVAGLAAFALSGRTDAAAPGAGVTSVRLPLSLVGRLVGALLAVPAALALLVPAGALVTVPLSWLGAIWSGAPDGSASGLGTGVEWPGNGFDPVGVLALAALTFLLTRRWSAAVPVLVVAAVEVPFALDAPWPVGLGVLLTAAVAGTAVAGWFPAPRPVPAGPAAPDAPIVPRPSTDGRTTAAVLAGAAVAVLAGVPAVAWSLASRPATIAVLAVVVAVLAVVATAAPRRPARIGALVAAVPAVPGLAVAVGSATGLAGTDLAFPLLVATMVLLAGAWTERRTYVLEIGAGLVALLALGVAAPSGVDTAITLTGLGALAGVQSARRRWYGYLAAVLLLAAVWAWLAVGSVAIPEAYTLPVAAVALGVGLTQLRRRNSWLVLGPALVAAALPSTILTLTDDRLGLRALVLGTAALVVTIIGAVTRRQAPFVIAGTALATVAVRALATALPELADSVPAWVPLSLGGIILLVLGTTYERRRRDLRRLSHAVRTMR